MKKLLAALGLTVMLVVTGCGGRDGVSINDTAASGEVDVTVEAGGTAAAGAMVQLLNANQAPIAEQRTDEQGAVAFQGVAPGAGYTAIATMDGATGKASDLRVTGGKTLAKIVLEEGSGPVGIVMGSVKASDRPLSGAVVKAGGKQATTDANGQFKIDDVPAGSVTLQASLSGYGPLSQALVVKPGASNAVTLLLSALATGPKANHTLVTTPSAVIELDAWSNPVKSLKASEAWSAIFLPDGGLLVADAGADKVQAYSDSGSKGSAYTGRALWQLGFGGVSGPHGATRTKDGNVLVADTGHNRVIEIDSANDITWTFKGLAGPRWAERLPNGNTIIADTGNNRVIEVKSDGTIAWGVGGSSDVLDHPSFAQRLANGNTLVTDAGNGRVMEITPDSKLASMIGGGQGPNLSNPGSAKRLPSGNTLIADTDANRVIEVTPSGDVAWKASVDQPLFADRF